jgi:hypothetical protein
MLPEQTANGPFTNSRVIFYAVRPWGWKDKFPPVVCSWYKDVRCNA